MDLLSEYSTATTQIQHGQRLTSARVPDSEPGSPVGGAHVVMAAQIQVAVQAWIADNMVPTATASSLDFVFLPPAVVSVLGTKRWCQDYCGYHNTLAPSITPLSHSLTARAVSSPGRFSIR